MKREMAAPDTYHDTLPPGHWCVHALSQSGYVLFEHV